jgi:hypothetical protein
MCLCNFGTLFGHCIGMFISGDLAVFWYPLQCSLFMVLPQVVVFGPGSLASVDITVSVGATDRIAGFESEKITVLPYFFLV